MHWSDWIAGPFIVMVGFAPVLIVRVELSSFAQPLSRPALFWWAMFPVGFVQVIAVIAALGSVVGGVMVMVFAILAFSIFIFLAPLTAWLRPTAQPRPARNFFLWIAAALVVLPYLAIRYHLLTNAIGP
jgi:hypothetical protein